VPILGRLDRGVALALESVVGALLGGVVLVSVLQVFCRYVLNQALAWPDEVGRFLFVWLAWLGAAAGLRRGIHLRLTVFVDRCPAAARRCTELAVTVLSAVFLLALLRGTPAVLEATGSTTFTALDVSTVYQYVAAPVGILIMLVYLARDFTRLVRGASNVGGGPGIEG
jgi:TRAP-type transport system small permease protein